MRSIVTHASRPDVKGAEVEREVDDDRVVPDSRRHERFDE
jgi:hypothetical protein